MRDGDFDRDLAEYLRTRKRARSVRELFDHFVDRFKPKRQPTVEFHESVELYDAPDEKKEISKTTNLAEEPTGELLARAKMRADDAVTDIRETAKIALKMIKDLPDDTLRRFKESDDFAKLKTLLKKHDLIK